MLLIQNKHSINSMSQSQDTGLSQEEYLERLLQGQHQYQQKVQSQLSGNRKGNESINDTIGINNTNSDGFFAGRTPGNTPFSSGNNGTNKSGAMALSNTMVIGVNQQQQLQQQNRMMNLLQERQQQQQLMVGSIIGGPADLSSNLGIAGLNANVGLDSRLSGNGIGSSISPNAWMDAGLNLSGLGSATIPGSGAPLYSTEQDLLMSTQRYPLVGNTIGANRLAMNGDSNGSINENPLASLLGGLSPYCIPHQNLTSAPASLNAQQKSNSNSLSDLLLTKQAQAALLQAAQARLPRTLRLPCGARGMKADHNSSTAYFDVPENARHGQHLLCSHSVCRAAGVKFRYCAYCKKPVTKQNFRSRHLHANLDPNNKKKKNEKESDGKRKKSNGKVEAKKKNESTKRKTMNVEKMSNTSSGENLKKFVTDEDDKDSIESIGALPTSGGAGKNEERPSKTRKLSISDGEKES